MTFSFRRRKLLVSADIGSSGVHLAAFRYGRGMKSAELVAHERKNFSFVKTGEDGFRKSLPILKEFIGSVAKQSWRAIDTVLVSLPHRVSLLALEEYRFRRPEPSHLVTPEELAEIWRRVKDEAARRSEPGWEVFAVELGDFVMDGYPLRRVSGRGEELRVSALTARMAEDNRKELETIEKAFPARKILYLPKAVSLRDYFWTKAGREASGIMLDIGEWDTALLVFSQGALEALRIFPFGGRDVTLRIAEAMRVSFEAAEAMKLKWSAGELSPAAASQVTKAVLPVAEFWRNEWGAFLSDLSRHFVIVPHWYCSGGGSALPVLLPLLQDQGWEKGFFAGGSTELTMLFPGPESKVFQGSLFRSPRDAVLFSLFFRMIHA